MTTHTLTSPLLSVRKHHCSISAHNLLSLTKDKVKDELRKALLVLLSKQDIHTFVIEKLDTEVSDHTSAYRCLSQLLSEIAKDLGIAVKVHLHESLDANFSAFCRVPWITRQTPRSLSSAVIEETEEFPLAA